MCLSTHCSALPPSSSSNASSPRRGADTDAKGCTAAAPRPREPGWKPAEGWPLLAIMRLAGASLILSALLATGFQIDPKQLCQLPGMQILDAKDNQPCVFTLLDANAVQMFFPGSPWNGANERQQEVFLSHALRSANDLSVWPATFSCWVPEPLFPENRLTGSWEIQLARLRISAVPPSVILSPPGANVTLRCLERMLPNSTVVHWRFKGRNLSSNSARWAVLGSDLFLLGVERNDSGPYSCHNGEQRLRTLRLVVEEPLEVPDFTCFRRSMYKDIICEWRLSRPVSSHVKANLWVAEGFTGRNYTKFQCRYYAKSQKFTCHVNRPSSDNILQVSMCTFHAGGMTMSENRLLWPNSLLKPDPPVNVTINVVEKAPQKLLITWQYPSSWGSRFYELKFQLRYRAETSPNYSQVELDRGVTSYVVSDALRSLRHVVQVRGREEFDHGSWSEWSRKSSGTPWTDPFDVELETTSYVSKFPYDYYFDGTDSTITPFPPRDTERPAVEDAAIIPLHTFLIMALSVIVGFALAVGIILRYRKRWRPSGEGKQSNGPSLTLATVAPSPPLSASPLLTPPASPLSESSVDSPGILDYNPYDVSNADYFLLPQ